MSILDAIIMGVIQGLTEFLPVSSSGHLVLFSKILGITSEGDILFEVLLHLGTLVAIFIAFYKDIGALILNGLQIVKNCFLYLGYFLRRDKQAFTKPVIVETKYQKFVMLVIVATIPTVIIALLLEKVILQAYTSLLFPAIGLIITATLLLITTKIESGQKEEQTTTYKNAALIGVFQGFATFPGISRSGSTMVAGLLVGMKKEFVVKFSFIMSIPAIIGATILQLMDFESGEPIGKLVTTYGLGVLASAIVGYICIRILLDIVRRGKLHYFAYYCYLVGTVLLATILFG